MDGFSFTLLTGLLAVNNILLVMILNKI